MGFSWEQVRVANSLGRCPECDVPLDDHELSTYCCGAWSPVDEDGQGGGDGFAFLRIGQRDGMDEEPSRGI